MHEVAPGSVILFELIPDDPLRHHRSKVLPLLKGLLHAAGREVHWLGMGVPVDETFRYRLTDAEMELLVRSVTGRNPDMVVINERLQDDQWEELGSRLEGIELVFTSTKGVSSLMGWFQEIFKLDPGELLGGGETYLDALMPDYGRELVNQVRELPFFYIRAGVSCLYKKPLAGNPWFEGVEVDEGACGCSFCGAGKSLDLYSVSSLTGFALTQVLAADRTVAQDEPIRFLMEGMILWHRMEDFFLELVKHPIRPMSFHFTPRVDEILRSRESLRRILPELEQAGHSLRIYSVGVENYSPRENQRFNKNTSNEQLEQVVELLVELTERFPDTFIFQKEGGFSFILYTPWTDLEDLKINIENIKKNPMISRTYVLGTRLQIFPKRAIAQLAARDGLLVERSGDVFYNAGCLTDFTMEELPYRFQHPEVELLFRFSRRVSMYGKVPDGDPDQRLIRSWREELPDGFDEDFLLFELAVAAVEQHRDLSRISELLLAMDAEISRRLGLDSLGHLQRMFFGEALARKLSQALLRLIPEKLSPTVSLKGAGIIKLDGRKTLKLTFDTNLEEPAEVFLTPRYHGVRSLVENRYFSLWHGKAEGPAALWAEQITRQVARISELVMERITRVR